MKAAIVSCFGYYDIRLQYVEEVFEERGFEIVLLLSDYDHINKKYITERTKNAIRLHVPAYKKNISAIRILSHFVFADRVYKKLKEEKPDYVYVLVPPNLLCRKVIQYKTKTNAKVIFDIIDLWPESFPTKVLEYTLQKYWRGLRNKYIRYADSIVIQCEYYRRFMNGYIDNSKQTVIYMCKEKTKSVDYTLNKVLGMDEIHFVYLGSINSIIDMDAIITLICNVKKKKKVFLKVIGDGENRAAFERKLKAAQIHYQYFGKIFDDKGLEKILATCHYGINIYKESTAIGLTMKSLDYFRFGLPVVTQNIVDTGILVEQYKSGYHIRQDNFSEIIDEITSCSFERWSEMQKQVEIMYEQEFSACICKRKLSDVINQIGNS